MKPFSDLKKQLLADPEIKTEYDHLGPEYELIMQIIKKRVEKKMSQAQLAQKVGTRQSAISRLESGNSNPSLNFLQKVSVALDTELSISLQ